MDDLLERLLEYSDLFLENLNLLLLSKTSLFILVSSTLLDNDISLLLFLVSVELLFFSFIVVESISLTHSLLSKFLVFKMNISLNFLNVPLSILDGLLLKLFDKESMLFLHLLFHTSLLNLDLILLLLNSFLQTLAILLPSHQLQFIFQLFFTDFLQFVKIIIELSQIFGCLIELFLFLLADLFNLVFVIIDCLSLDFFIFLLVGCNFVFELQHQFCCFVVLFGQPEDDVFFVLILLFVSILQPIDFGVKFLNLFFFLANHIVNNIDISDFDQTFAVD